MGGLAYSVTDSIGGELYFQGDDATRFRAIWYGYAPCRAYSNFASCLRWHGYEFDYSEVITDVDGMGNTPLDLHEG